MQIDLQIRIQPWQPPPQALRFSHSRGERETRVTGDEPLSPSRLPLRAHFLQKRDVWVRGSSRGICPEEFLCINKKKTTTTTKRQNQKTDKQAKKGDKEQ